MKINNIILDILDWIRRNLWYEKHYIKKKPYQIIKTSISQKGILKLVERDTVRSVKTFIFTPISTGKPDLLVRKDVKDIHICLDHLGTLDDSEVDKRTNFKLLENNASFKLVNSKHFKVSKQKATHTHRVTVLQSSRWLNPKGEYFTDVLFTEEYDFLGSCYSKHRDHFADIIITDLANLLKYRSLKEINWAWEIELAQKRFMGSFYIPDHIPTRYFL